MIKSQLIGQLARREPATCRAMTRTGWCPPCWTACAHMMATGGRVELRGFGAFSVRARPPRAGRNPRTGEAVEVRGKAAPFFKRRQGAARDRLNLFGEA